MAIEHSICDGCERRFEDGQERVYPETCPMCGAIQGRHALGPWGYLFLGVVLAIGALGRYCASPPVS